MKDKPMNEDFAVVEENNVFCEVEKYVFFKRLLPRHSLDMAGVQL